MNPNVKTLLLNEMTPEYFKACCKSTDTFVIGIPKAFIESRDMQFIDAWMHTLRTCEESKNKKFLMTTNGYEDDAREVYQIPEVCDYITKVFKKYPELYYFLEKEPSIWIPIIIASNVPINERKAGKIDVNIMKYADFLLASMKGILSIPYLTQQDAEIYADWIEKQIG